MTPSKSFLGLLLRPVLIAAVAALLLRSTVQTYSIPSGSMSPTLEAGDHIVVTPLGLPFLNRSPQRGDVVVFRSPMVSDEFFVKRVIAIPGDEIEIRDRDVMVNGRPLSEPWIAPGVSHGTRPAEILPDGFYFVMGDARGNSVDSRTWGLLAGDRIVGKARLVFWSSGGELAEAANAAVIRSRKSGIAEPRWDRMFTIIR